MYLSVLLTSLPGDVTTTVRQAAALGFACVDIVALTDRPAADREALADTGLRVSCGALGRGLPEGHTLDAGDVQLRRRTIDLLRRQLDDLAQLGATDAYLVPGTDTDDAALARFTEAVVLLAEDAGRRRINLCIEHTPGRALPTAAGVLDWLGHAGHDNLALLLDVGHCLLSREDAPDVIRAAGSRLGYVHFDDNDGASDLHLPLKAGLLDDDQLRQVLAALAALGYAGALTLELKPGVGDPREALRLGKSLLESLGKLT
jgi:sugar phosphate isomerase/epimerase